MTDNLEHGWIVDGIPACEDYDENFCRYCGKYISEDERIYIGEGKYICKECNGDYDD